MSISLNNLKRRDFLKGSTASATLALAPSLVRAAENQPERMKPNILVVVCDQMVLDAVSAYKQHFTDPAYLCHWSHTPNLDKLVKGGVSFTLSHSQNPVCCPARSCMFTGRYSIETGVIHNNIGIDREVLNLGQWLEAHSDYERVYCGKWHAGGPWNNPTVDGPRKIPGFDTIPSGPDIWGRDMDYGVSSGVEAYLRNYRGDKPFLAVAGFMDPHDICFWSPQLNSGQVRGNNLFKLMDQYPVLPPNKKYDFDEIWKGSINYSDMQWQNYIYDYCRMIERLDCNVGRLLQAVRDRNDDTIIIFTSDHGDGVARHGRVSKWHPYEESVKVPLIVYAPKFGVRSNVIDSEHLVSGADITPTICDYAGIKPPPNCRGRSLRPLLEGHATDWHDSLFIELREVGRVIRSQRYKFVMSYKPAPLKPKRAIEQAYISKASGKPVEFLPGEGFKLERQEQTMLFDMVNDPWEHNNLSSESKYRDIIAQHEQMLASYEQDIIPGHSFTRK